MTLTVEQLIGLLLAAFIIGAFLALAIVDGVNSPPPRDEEEYESEVARATAFRIKNNFSDARRHLRKAREELMYLERDLTQEAIQQLKGEPLDD